MNTNTQGFGLQRLNLAVLLCFVAFFFLSTRSVFACYQYNSDTKKCEQVVACLPSNDYANKSLCESENAVPRMGLGVFQQIGGYQVETTQESVVNTTASIISNSLGGLTVLGALGFIMYFVLGAISWITAEGDTSKITKARDQMVQGVIGLVVIVAAYGVIGLIGSVIGLDILNFGGLINSILPTTTTNAP